MTLRKIFAFLIGLFLSNCSLFESDIYTLYRNSVLDPNMRIHVSTFDAEGDSDYNRGNCDLAKDLFMKQEGVKTIFWCEKGKYRK